MHLFHCFQLHESLDGPVDYYIDFFKLLMALKDRKFFDQF